MDFKFLKSLYKSIRGQVRGQLWLFSDSDVPSAIPRIIHLSSFCYLGHIIFLKQQHRTLFITDNEVIV